MACISPPGISDSDLLAYLDGEAGGAVQEHLARCAHCRARAQELAGIERRLSAELYRFECPRSDELGEYYLELLAPERAREVARHIAACPLCAREVAGLQGYLQDLAPEIEHRRLEAAGARVQVWIARLVEGVAGAGMLPGVAPSFAGLRGGQEGPRVYEAGDVQISIEVQADPEHLGSFSVLGLLIAPRVGAFDVHLWQRGTHVMSVTVDDLGNFVFPDLEAGSYDLIVSGPEIEVHVQDLEVGSDLRGEETRVGI